MKTEFKIAIVVVVISLVLGTAAGLLVQGTQPLDQHFHLRALAFNSPEATSCPGLLQNSTNWLQIQVTGNRTGINFLSTEVLSQGQAQLNLPLNQTAYVYYNSVNSTFEKIDVPLAAYFSGGDALEVSVSYFVTNFPPVTVTLGRTPLTGDPFSC